jgi:hypothetical protein
VQVLNFPELTLEEIKFQIKAINTRYTAERAKAIKPQKRRCRPTLPLRTEIVLVQTSTFILAWLLYSTNLSVNNSSILNNVSTFIC